MEEIFCENNVPQVIRSMICQECSLELVFLKVFPNIYTLNMDLLCMKKRFKWREYCKSTLNSAC